MKNTFIRKIVFSALLTIPVFSGVNAQRTMEKLNRSIVTQKVSKGIYVNWRITSDEWRDTGYKLYRDGVMIYDSEISGPSNYLDTAGSDASVYTVTSYKIINGESIESAPAECTIPLVKNGYFEIPMADLPDGKTGYFLNDATAADLDGDGQMEVIIKRLNTDWSTTNTNYTYFEAYKLDGTMLWRIDVGPNITMDVEINIAAFDFDGDGKAEVFMRTSDNTIFGDGKSVGDRDGDGITNYRNHIGGDGFMNAGPEYLSLIDGETGAELDWVDFIPRGNSSDWGDTYGHRANKFFFGAPYLDGLKPSLFIGRGIYTKTIMRTYDVVNKKLVKRWEFTTDKNPSYYGQGNHNFTIADTDGDGFDEIVWGQMCVDHDGKGLYSTGLGHGDAMHVSDFDPYRKGIEVFGCLEDNPGLNFRCGKTGKILIRHITAKDCGRCCAGKITDDVKGAQLWGGGFGFSATDREYINHFGVAENYTIYWDGDLLKEICDHRNFSTATGHGYGHITKFKGYGNIVSLLEADAGSCNYTKGTPCLQADILGDWREEVIWWKTNHKALRVYLTPYETEHKIYTLLHDHQYRQAICWQMCGYNQPPHPSFYLGSDFPEPIPAKSTSGKMVWQGNGSVWDNSSAEWMDGDDQVNLIAGTSTAEKFENGQSVLFDGRGVARNITLNGELTPSILTFSDLNDYTLSGDGKLTGAMRLDKLGEGKLTIQGNHDYSGLTDLWEGVLCLDGVFKNSPVNVRRHAELELKGEFTGDINTEYNGSIYVAGSDADDLIVNGDINLVEGAKLIFDISDTPDKPDDASAQLSGQRSDFLNLKGKLTIGHKAIISVHKISSELTAGDYHIADINNLEGDLTGVKIEGTLGSVAELIYDESTKALYLRIIGVRSAASVNWTGSVDSAWDVALSTNWSKDNDADIFVANDSVFFTQDADNMMVSIDEVIPVKYMEVNGGNYTFNGTGLLTGNMNLVVDGGATVTINQRNDFTGSTTVTGGSTLISKFAPTETGNGGFGVKNSSYNSLILKDSSTVRILTENEQVERGVTFQGENGGFIDAVSTYYWNGAFKGTRFTKTGTGKLYISGASSALSETVVKAGTLVLHTGDAVRTGVGSKVILEGGQLECSNNIYDYAAIGYDMEVKGTATYIAAPRCEYNGKLTGSGTLNWYVDFVRAYINGDYSGFTGKLRLYGNGANSSYSNDFIYNNNNGLPNCAVEIYENVSLFYKNMGTTTIEMGSLTGKAGAKINANLKVGALNTSTTFAGLIEGGYGITKVGKGTFTISAPSTYTGATTISEGTMTFSGSKRGGGSVTVAAGATLNGTDSIKGNITLSAATATANGGRLVGTPKIVNNVTMQNGSAISPADSSRIGEMSIGGNLVMKSGTTYEAQISGSLTARSDKVIVAGKTTLAGTLKVRMTSSYLSTGFEFKIIDCDNITGEFDNYILPELKENQIWDLSKIGNGIIAVAEGTGLNDNEFTAGLLENPTNGVFRLALENAPETINIKVCNLNGQIVYDAVVEVENGIVTIDITNQEKGVYLLYLGEKENALRMIKQ